VKVVFDTNVLVSALVFPGGRGEAALLRVVEEQDPLYFSKPILDELLASSRASSRGTRKSYPALRCSFLSSESL
jgi:predicted nucleic acid-binding protein